MILFYNEITKISCLFIFSLFLAVIILFLSFRLSTYNPDTEKLSAYECGFDSYSFSGQMFWIKHKEKIVDFFLFLTITLSSTFLYCLTFVLKIKILIFNLKDKILQLDMLIVLLDNQAILLQQKRKVAMWAKISNNMETVVGILLGVVIAIAIVLFFFSDKGGPGGSASSSTGDFFSSKGKGSPGSFAKSPSNMEVRDINSNVDISTNITNNSLSSITEGNVIETPILDLAESLNKTLSVTFGQKYAILFPNVAIWDIISKKHLFEQSPTVRVGSVLQDWVDNLTKNYWKLDRGENSTETLKSIELTLNSIDLNLPPFIEQVNSFLIQTNLNQTTLNLDSDLLYVEEAREAAFKLTQILSEHESLLNQILPVNILVPEWFGGLIGFYSFLRVVSNLYSNDLCNYLVGITALIEVSNISDKDLLLKKTLLEKIEFIYKYVSRFTSNSNYGNRMGGGAFLSVMKEGEYLEEETSSDVFRNLLKIVLKYRDYFRINPSDIFLFL